MAKDDQEQYSYETNVVLLKLMEKLKLATKLKPYGPLEPQN